MMTVGEISEKSKSAFAALAPLEAVLFDIGFNGGVPIDEDFFVQNIAGKHNDDIAAALFPDDIERGLKFCVDKEAYFRKYSLSLILSDSVSGIKAGVAAGMPVVGLTTRNPEQLLMTANPALLIENYEDLKLWTVLEELGKKAGDA
ncbi:hypothetical protein E3N88_41764 [Mikania micrantha]|uniref:Uncharacterized protein n=1 Tax=Mikania micrantha TaxID=192012 RepID=A0A5N6LJR1_9ASTR|nr:hypothetical protein E3N88_41764 [Mikania micrantha]